MKNKLFKILLVALCVITCCFTCIGCAPTKPNDEDGGNTVTKSKFYLLGNTTNSQMFGCILQSKTKTIIIDGGVSGDRNQITNFIRENNINKIDAWYFTHPHADHMGAFCSIYKNAVIIPVDKIYHHFPSVDALKEYGSRNEAEVALWDQMEEIFANKFLGKVEKVNVGDRMTFDEISIEILRVHNPAITTDFVNNSSMVFRIENANASILILGDLGVAGGQDVMSKVPLKFLQTDYTQMAHHGQQGVSKEFYDYIIPKRCLWPTPTWLWDNDNGGGYNSGSWKTLETRSWMEELGVTEHYVSKDGTVKIEF